MWTLVREPPASSSSRSTPMYFSSAKPFILAALTICDTSFGVLGHPNLRATVSTTQSSQEQGRIIVIPPRSNDTGLKQIPDAAHPFIAPGPNDQRGPCPALNTLANHGYLPRNGIVSLADVVDGVREGFNMDHDLAVALTSFGILSRGNAFTNQLSIGGPSPLVPPLPGNIDGPVARGIATHGRFEGDVSMTRQDAAIGDNRDFQDSLYDILLLNVGQFGDDSPITGNRSIVTTKVMQEFKFSRFVTDQVANPELQYHVGRFILSYGESGFVLNFFANGTNNILSVPTMGSFFRNQTFPQNWHRRSTPGTAKIIGDAITEIRSAHPISPGANNVSGQYVVDTDDLDGSDGCAFYRNLAGDNLPAILLNTTGILKQNVNTLVNALASTLGCNVTLPRGPANV